MATAPSKPETWLDAPGRCIARWLAIGAGLSLLAHCTMVGFLTVFERLIGQAGMGFAQQSASASQSVSTATTLVIVYIRLGLMKRSITQSEFVVVLGLSLGNVIWSLLLHPQHSIASFLSLGMALLVMLPELFKRTKPS